MRARCSLTLPWRAAQRLPRSLAACFCAHSFAPANGSDSTGLALIRPIPVSAQESRYAARPSGRQEPPAQRQGGPSCQADETVPQIRHVREALPRKSQPHRGKPHEAWTHDPVKADDVIDALK